MTSSNLAPEEVEQVRQTARVTFGLIVTALMLLVCAVLLMESARMDNGTKALLITLSAFSGLIGAIATAMFVSRGGAEAHFSYLGVLSLMMYCLSILTLYVTGTFVYAVCTLDQAPKVDHPKNKSVFITVTVFLIPCALYCIYATIQLPSMYSFMKEFRNSQRSRKVRLIRYLIPKPEQAAF